MDGAGLFWWGVVWWLGVVWLSLVGVARLLSEMLVNFEVVDAPPWDC